MNGAPVENAVWYLRRSRLFERVDEDVVQGYSHLFVQRTYPAKSVLFAQGDPARMIYLVKRGKVRISRVTSDGKDVTLAILGPGDIFGEEVVFNDEVERTTQATCIETSYLCLSRMQDMFAMLSRNPIISLNIAKYLQEQRDDALATVEDLSSLKVPDRIMRLFERLVADHGVATRTDTCIDVRLTHAQVASLIGSTRETVSLEITRLVRAGRLAIEGNRFILPRAMARPV